RAHLGAGRILAVHADRRRRLRARAPVDEVEMDHRPTAVRAALRAGLDARLAADAPALVDDEDVRAHATRSTRTALTLYSGIFDSGSSARWVSWLAACAPGQWYGMKTVSGRIVSTTAAGNVIDPRRELTRTVSPFRTPRRSARRGCISQSGSG